MHHTQKKYSWIIAILAIALLPIQTFAFTGGVVHNTIHKPVQEFRTDRIIVKMKNDNKPFRVVTLAHNETVENAIATYKKQNTVLYAEPDYIASIDATPNDPYFSPFQWNFDNATNSGINMNEAWDITTGSTSTLVAVIDTGIAYETATHASTTYYRAPDLSNTCLIPGYDFINNDSWANDDNGHGTHVAGTIAQSTNNGTGVAGIAYDTCVMPIKVLDASGSGSYASVANGIYYATDHGAQVINMSLGGTSDSSVLRDAVAYAYNHGVTVVAAAGNSNTSAPHYPSSYNDYVISVGATDYTKSRAPYSNYGQDVDVVAPGGDTSEDMNGDGYSDGILQNTFSGALDNFGYYFFQGTSMASPHVAGVAALLIAHGNATTPDDIRTALQSTAQDLGASGKDTQFGYGLVDAFSALNWSASSTPVNKAPVANAGTDKTVTVNTSVTFSGNASTDDGTIVSYQWNFGDGSTATGISVDHTYTTTGTYTVSLMVTDDGGLTATDTAIVTVTPVPVDLPPVADAGADRNVLAGTTILFSGASSTDDGRIVSYQWDFGDGSSASAVNASNTYNTVGTYTVTLTVTDNKGQTGTDSATVVVRPAHVTIENISAINTRRNRNYDITVSALNNETDAQTTIYHIDVIAPNGAKVTWAGLADQTGTIPAGGTLNKRWTNTVPSNAARGTYRVNAKLTVHGVVTNTATKTFTVSK